MSKIVGHSKVKRRKCTLYPDCLKLSNCDTNNTCYEFEAHYEIRQIRDTMRKVIMRANIADALGIDVSQVSVKATTEEGLGFTGEGLGISAQAICLLDSPRDFATMDMASNCEGCKGCMRNVD